MKPFDNPSQGVPLTLLRFQSLNLNQGGLSAWFHTRYLASEAIFENGGKYSITSNQFFNFANVLTHNKKSMKKVNF